MEPAQRVFVLRAHLLIIALFIGSSLVAGCTSAPTPVAKSTSQPPAPSATANETAGSVSGRVVDDEGFPVVGATVALLEVHAQTTTDDSGRFTMNDVPAGKYGLVVNKVGYQQFSKKVEVQLGQVTDVKITLVPFVIPTEPYTTTVQREGFVGFGNVFVDDVVLGPVNNSVVNGYWCDHCFLVFGMEPGPAGGRTETLWVSGQSVPPALNSDVWLMVKKDWTTGEYGNGKPIVETYFSDRESHNWTVGELDAVKTTTKLMDSIQGGTTVNAQLRVRVYNSFSYYGALDPSFTALPPK